MSQPSARFLPFESSEGVGLLEVVCLYCRTAEAADNGAIGLGAWIRMCCVELMDVLVEDTEEAVQSRLSCFTCGVGGEYQCRGDVCVVVCLFGP